MTQCSSEDRGNYCTYLPTCMYVCMYLTLRRHGSRSSTMILPVLNFRCRIHEPSVTSGTRARAVPLWIPSSTTYSSARVLRRDRARWTTTTTTVWRAPWFGGLIIPPSAMMIHTVPLLRQPDSLSLSLSLSYLVQPRQVHLSLRAKVLCLVRSWMPVVMLYRQ